MTPFFCRRPVRSGFTLVEVLVVMAIAAILLAVAMPNFQNIIANTRTSEAANALIGTFDLARTEAVRRGLNVTVCRSTNAEVALPTCAGVGDWADGWFVFVDNSGVQGVRDAGDNEILYRQQGWSAADARSHINASVNAPVAFVGAIAYQANGLRLPLAGDPAPPFRFEIGYRRGAEAAPGLSPRCLQVTFVGQSIINRAQCP